VNSCDDFALFDLHKATASPKCERVTEVTKRHKAALPSSFLLHFFYVYIATRTNLESCQGAASQPPAVPCFQFPPLYPFFRTQYLIGPVLLRTRFCESSSKQNAAVRCAPRVAFITLLPFLYLSIYPITLYACRSSDAEKSPFYLERQISQTVSAAFYSFTYSLELV